MDVPDAESQRKLMDAMGAMLEHTQEVECSCDDVYRLMDEYAEAVRSGRDVRYLLPLVHHHLEMCGDCRQELEALLKALEA
jgi:hypothetical protein